MKLKDLTRQYNSIKLDSASEEEIRGRVFDYFRQSLPEESNITYHYWILRPAMTVLAVFLFIFCAGFGTVAMAKNSLPGDFLYPVKKISEKSQMFFAFRASQKVVLRAEILNNRLSEVRVLVQKAEMGDEESASELDVLAENFTQELEVLKQEIGEQVPAETGHFSTKDLLDTESLDQGSLPIQDHRQIFAVLPSEDIEKLLTETRELLAENNMALALVRIQEVEKSLRQAQDGELVESLVQNQESGKTETEVMGTEATPSEPTQKLPVPAGQPVIKEPVGPSNIPETPQPQSSKVQLPLGSTGNVSSQGDFKVKIEKESPAQTGMIREK